MWCCNAADSMASFGHFFQFYANAWISSQKKKQNILPLNFASATFLHYLFIPSYLVFKA